MKYLLAATAFVMSAGFAQAQDATTYTFNGSFEDAAFGVETAIVGRGLVVDWVSHVGEMLERTRADVGSDVVIFDNADIFMFCSATLSRTVMEADPANITYCPYGVFVTEREGVVSVGYRNLPDGPMQEVQALLDEIAREASEN
jgi:uncharacterized protein (DUF302 family)